MLTITNACKLVTRSHNYTYRLAAIATTKLLTPPTV